jgi:hypothetical protein
MNRIVAFLIAGVLLVAGVGTCFAPPAYIDSAVEWTGWATASGPPEVVVIDVKGQHSQDIAEVFTSKAVRDTVKTCKFFRWVPPTVEGPDLGDVQWALDAAKTKTPPVVCVRRGSKVTVTPLPMPSAAMVTFLKKNGAQ